MFIASIISGLKVFTYWETYVGILVYLGIFLIPLIITNLIVKDKESDIGLTVYANVIAPVFQSIAIIACILLLSPIIFGLSVDAAWDYLWKAIALDAGAVLMLVGITIFINIGLIFLTCYIPFFYPFRYLQMILLSVGALIYACRLHSLIHPDIVSIHALNLFPGFEFSAGLLLVSYILAKAGKIVVGYTVAIAAIANDRLRDKFEEGLSTWDELIMYPFATLFSFIPIFTYGAWLGNQIRGGF